MLFVIAGSVVTCFLALENRGSMAHSSTHDSSSFPIHVDHMQLLSSAMMSQANALSILIASLLLLAFVFVTQVRKLLSVRQLVARRKRRHSNAPLIDQSELHWLSRFVRSPEFVRPA